MDQRALDAFYTREDLKRALEAFIDADRAFDAVFARGSDPTAAIEQVEAARAAVKAAYVRHNAALDALIASAPVATHANT